MASPASLQPLTVLPTCSTHHVMHNVYMCVYCLVHACIHIFLLSVEHANSTSRVIFLTDLCSTVDSVNDEKRLLSTIKQNADRDIYTTVVGIGMVIIVMLSEPSKIQFTLYTLYNINSHN